MKRTRKGFTLVELLIVIAILGVLATMMSLTAGDSTAKAKAAQIVADFKVISSAVSIYMMDSNDTIPQVKYFNETASPDYLGGKLKGYTVTSTDNSVKGWYVATAQDALTDSIVTAIQNASADLNMIGIGTGGKGGVKMRIH